MIKFSVRIAFFAVIIALAGVVSNAAAIEKISPDSKAVKLVNDLLKALSISDPAERLAAVKPLVHRSLLNKDGTDLSWNIKKYSYKKAYQNVKFYKIPVSIYEVHKGRTLTIGFRKTAQRGRIDKYFVNKKEGVNGRPAPIAVFWPEDGGEPTIVGMGSL